MSCPGVDIECRGCLGDCLRLDSYFSGSLNRQESQITFIYGGDLDLQRIWSFVSPVTKYSEFIKKFMYFFLLKVSKKGNHSSFSQNNRHITCAI